MLNLTPDYFDKDYYEGGKGYHSYNDDGRFQQWADQVASLKPKSVLDFGCAKGYLVKALRDRGIETYGIDISEWAVAQAPEEVKDYVSTTTWRDVDLIVSYDTLEHIPEQELNKIRTLFRKHGKRFFLTVGTLDTPNWEHDASHITMYKLDWWQQWLPEAEWRDSI